MKARVLRQDWDWWTIYDGGEGVGKSSVAIRDGIMTSGDLFSLEESVVYDPEEFLQRIDTTPKYGTLILDEAGVAWYNRDFQSLVNKSLAKASQQCRDRNLNVILCVPNLNLLDRVAIVRHRTWGHVTAPGFRRGRTEYMQPYWKKYGGESLPFWRTLFFVTFGPLPEELYTKYKDIKIKKSREGLAAFIDIIERKKEKDLNYHPRPEDLAKKILESSDKKKYLNRRKTYDKDLIRYDLEIPDALARTVSKILNKTIDA